VTESTSLAGVRDALPGVADGVESVVVGGEAVVHSAGRIHHLSAIATTVWECCDGQVTLDELAAELAVAFSADPVRVRADVEAAVAELVEQGLLRSREPGPPAGAATFELLVDPPGSCASCDTAPPWPDVGSFVVGRRVVGVGTSRDLGAALREALLPHSVGGDLAPNGERPYFGVTVAEPTDDRGPRPLHLLHRGADVVVRSRRVDRVLRGLLAHLATCGDLPAMGLVPVEAAVLVRDGRAALVRRPSRPVAFERRAARAGFRVVDAPVALVDPESGEVVVGAPGLDVDVDPLTRFADRRGDADVPAEPVAAPWGRYRIALLGTATQPGPSGVLMTFAPARDGLWADDGALDLLAELASAVPVRRAVAPHDVAAAWTDLRS
jgi:hypothetical protein